MKPMALAALVALALLAAAGCDPARSDAVAALGPETAGVRRGPLHRPGQPCLLCHDGSIGNPEAFSVAGTVFDKPSSTQPVDNALVHLTDATGSSYDARTNAAGNFYVLPREWTPNFPMVATVTPPTGNAAVAMHTFISRDGSCAGCHADPAGPDSPGHISIVLDDGGTPP